MCCNNCNRGPQGIQGVPGVLNVLYQNNTNTESQITDAGDEAFILSNANVLEYIAISNGRYRVSLQAKVLNSGLGAENLNIIPTKNVGSQAFPNVGTPLLYTGAVESIEIIGTFIVYEFDVFLLAGESIALTFTDTLGSSNLTLNDNIFLIDKIN